MRMPPHVVLNNRAMVWWHGQQHNFQLTTTITLISAKMLKSARIHGIVLTLEGPVGHMILWGFDCSFKSEWATVRKRWPSTVAGRAWHQATKVAETLNSGRPGAACTAATPAV